MEQLPNLSGLSHEEKDTIIHLLFDTVLALCQQVAALRAGNAKLKAELQKLRGQLPKNQLVEASFEANAPNKSYTTPLRNKSSPILM
jgi:regulator of replication initiation timing